MSVDVVVVDNGSTDESVSRLRGWARPEHNSAESYNNQYAGTNSYEKLDHSVESLDGSRPELAGIRLDLIKSSTNRGFAGGNNLGLKLLLEREHIEYVWLLNNDTIIEPGAAHALIERMDDDKRVGMCGTVVRYYYKPEVYQALNGSTFCLLTGTSRSLGAHQPLSYQFDASEIAARTDFVIGASLCVSRAFVEEIGLMDEGYFLYYEEVDWTYRNRGKFGISFAEKATIFHKEGGSIGSNTDSKCRSRLSDYYLLRSRLRFIRKHAFYLLPIHWALAIVQIVRRLNRGQPAKAIILMRALMGLSYV